MLTMGPAALEENPADDDDDHDPRQDVGQQYKVSQTAIGSRRWPVCALDITDDHCGPGR